MIFEKINADLQRSIKDRNELLTSVLRMMKSKITYVAPKADLPEPELLKILHKYTKELKEAMEFAEKASRPETLAQLQKELKIVEGYLPARLSEDEIIALVKASIEKTGAASMKDMGRVMKDVMAGNATLDGQVIRDLVSRLLPPA
jgi:uncharacterized protein